MYSIELVSYKSGCLFTFIGYVRTGHCVTAIFKSLHKCNGSRSPLFRPLCMSVIADLHSTLTDGLERSIRHSLQVSTASRRLIASYRFYELCCKPAPFRHQGYTIFNHYQVDLNCVKVSQNTSTFSNKLKNGNPFTK